MDNPPTPRRGGSFSRTRISLEFEAEVVERRTRRRPSGRRPRPDGLLSRVRRPALGPGDDRRRRGPPGRRGRGADRPCPGPRDRRRPRVRGRVDWDVRFDHMQQHTGQHILSQAFIEVLNGETRSFHLGPETSTLEIGIGAGRRRRPRPRRAPGQRGRLREPGGQDLFRPARAHRRGPLPPAAEERGDAPRRRGRRLRPFGLRRDALPDGRARSG